jgi:FG-GAP-like repeat
VTILVNNGAADFTEPASSPEPAGDGPSDLALADLNGDTDPDLAVSNGNSEDVTILRNEGAADFTQPASSPEGAGVLPVGVAAADLEGDLDRDLAVVNEFTEDVTILLNQGAGNLSEPASSPEPAGIFARSIAAAAFDADADVDLAVTNLGSDDVTILGNNGAANFTEPSSSPEAAGDGPDDVVAADLDGDSDQDLAVVNFASDNVTILKNR